MKQHMPRTMLLASVVLLALVGCETMGGGGNQMQTTVYDTHRRIVKLDKELESSVTRLNETTATLLARVEESDQQTRMLRGMLEENQMKLDTLGREIEGMKTTLYRHWNLTTTPGSAAPMGPPRNVSTGEVTIEGAPALAPIPPVAPAPVVSPPQHELMDSSPAPPMQTAAAVPTPPDPAPPVPVATAPAPGDVDPHMVYQQAQRSYADKDYANALRQFDDFLGRHPNHEQSGNALFWKAKCLLDLNRNADAAQAFGAFRNAFPTNSKVPFAMQNEAVAYSRLGQNAQAEAMMQAVIEQYPVSPAADQARADLRKLRGE